MRDIESEFDEQIAAAEAESDLERRMRVEVKHVQVDKTLDGEDDDEKEQQESSEAERERGGRRATPKSSLLGDVVSGRVLLHDYVKQYYRHLLLIAGLTFVSIFVMFWSLRVDMRHNALNHEVQLLRERSIRMRESSYARSSHSAIVRELERRGIDLKDARTPSVVIDD